MTKSVKIVDATPDLKDRQIEVTVPGFEPPQKTLIPIGGEAEFTVHADNSLEIREVNVAAEAASEPAPSEAGPGAARGQEDKASA